MTLPRSVADVLKDHVTLEVEGIDRMYLNVYQPRLQTDRGVAAFFRFHRGETFASSALMDADEQGLHRRRRALRRAGTDPPDHVRQGPAQGRRRQGVPRPIPRQRGDRLRGQGPGEDAGLPHREAPQSRHRADLPLDRAKHGHGQPLLLLRPRRGLRPVLPQVLHLLPLQRQALHQRPRVRQATTGQGRDRLRGPGQRHPELRRPPTAAATLRRPLGREDRRAAAEVAGATAPSVHRRGSPGRLSLRRVDPPGRVLADPGPGPAAVPAASSSRR